MADDEQNKSGMISGLVQEYFAQLRGITNGLQGMAGFGERLPSAPSAFPLPGALSAAQLKSITDSVAAQRHSIEALKAQLSSFEEQLVTLERILGPLAEWSSTWAELEQQLLNMGAGPRPQGQSSGS
jgi:hypothetical protein